MAMCVLQLVTCILLIVAIELEQIKRLKGACRRCNYSKMLTEIESHPAIELQRKGIFVQDLTYEKREIDLIKRTYFRDVSFHVKQGELLTIVNAQDARKTELIQTIIHEHSPDSGRVTIGGIDMSGVCGQYPGGLIGYAPQQLNLFEKLTVQEHMDFFAKIKEAHDKSEIEAVLIGLNLIEHRTKMARALC